MKIIELKEIKEMNWEDISHFKAKQLTNEAFIYAHDKLEMNFCNKCQIMELSEYLIWCDNGNAYCSSCWNKFKKKPKLWHL